MEEQAADATIQLPEQASTLAPMVDSLYYDIFWISVVFFVAIVGCMVVFAWRYRRRKGHKSKPPGHHNALELFWTFSPLILLAYMFHEGFQGFLFMSVPPPNSINVRVEAFQWGWRFQQPNGCVESELWVPEGEPVRLIMGSIPRGTGAGQGAVIHSFYVPALRVKRDVVPGMFTSLWFEATRRGTYDIFCAEYCGVGAPAEGARLSDADLRANGRPTAAAGHAGMLSRIHVVSPEEYRDHLRACMRIPDQYGGDYAAWGRDLFTENGCPACHVTTAGAPASVGPNLANVAGYPQPIEGGAPVVADVDYLRESIREPQATIVEGFGGASMPSFAALGELKIDALVAYIGSLSDRGEDVVQAVQAAHAEQ
ncbi:MAG TPA: cytochrome c oxidase subunit II transmembrane domain-containing protein [Sandaracinaceae bacterium]